MAKAKATRKSSKAKKKSWLRIYSAKPFNQVVIGETSVSEPSLAVGKPISVNLMNLTGDIKKQQINMKFEIDNISEGKAYTKVTGYDIVSSAFKRFVRRRSSKADLSFEAVTSDNIKVRIKPIVLTRGKTNKSVLTAIRKHTKEFIKKTFASTGYQNIIQSITSHRLQMTLKRELAKIHPIKIIEIKSLKLISKKPSEKKQPEKKQVKAETKTAEPDKEPTETKVEEPDKEPTETKVEEQDKEPTETKTKE